MIIKLEISVSPQAADLSSRVSMEESLYAALVIGPVVSYYDVYYDLRDFSCELEIPNLADYQLAIL